MVAILHQIVRASYPVPGGGSGYSFTMTAGDFSGSIQGYSNGTFIDTFGSIDVEPLPGNPLLTFFGGSLTNGIGFQGDCLSQLSGKSVWIDGVEYPFNDSDWTYDADNDNTGGVWTANTITFTPTQTYSIEIK